MGSTSDLWPRTKIFNYAALGFFILLFVGVSYAIGVATSDSTQTWYLELNRSPLTPPGYVFGIVWTVLYTVMAISIWLVWRKRDVISFAPIAIIFALHMILNWAWSFVFFEFHFLALSFVWLLGVAILAISCAVLFYRVSKPAAYLLIPYLGWLGFASYLSFYIWRHN